MALGGFRGAGGPTSLAPMSKSAKARKTGKRYSSEEKAEIARFIAHYNSEQGRGGQTAAAKRFGVSPITLSIWGRAAKKTASTGRRAEWPKKVGAGAPSGRS